MKRSNEDVVGRPKLSDPHRDVAGLSPLAGSKGSQPILDVASFRHALDDPMGTAMDDADLIADFAEFMAGDASPASNVLLEPDPDFRERLRRRLWRTHVVTHLRDGGETH
jgi:hypothetical protein